MLPVVRWWSIHDKLGVEDKSRGKKGLRRRILRALNGFFPDSLCCFIQTDENTFLSSLSLTSVVDLGKNGKERRDFMQFDALTFVCFTSGLCLELI